MTSLRSKLSAIALVVAGVGVLGFTLQEPARSNEVSIKLAPANAAKLVEATSAAPAEWRAVGDEAKLINASMPFSTAPVQAAHPFAHSGDGLDQRRALLCLTQAVYYESGFEPMAGRRAVAQVVLNRMRHPAFPKSVCGVVYQGSRSPVCQFSFVCDGSLYRAPGRRAWDEARKIAEAALAGYVEQSVGSATHFHADYVAPRWAPMLNKVAKFGAHIFYRWPGAWGQRGAFTGRYIGEPHDPLALRPPLRVAQLPGSGSEATAQLHAGPPIARAPNDVGGLLDVSKGWTLNIPMPNETGTRASGMIAQQEGKPQAKPSAKPGSEPTTAIAASASPIPGGR